ncbi:TetR family transcriptional regulator [Cryobacterium sp. GrIS_2_6]|uniref:TetR family transcriptional regulator n=1 Tax=Cryobacterium sp. GrIS_2_6 TaxID=3162785 RepID=UPI002DFA2C6E|nr:TetR family transcriptional regulator [Cryobacterium psychrotolerans]MEC5151857.1 AcrR family transcriptional regulator [Cryobacterium psychrotolerans]
MPPDATDTKRRILAAAHTEFATYGLAGARVDRIAAAAAANKRSIYVHFGPKEELFDVVIARSLEELEHQVPFDPRNLTEYAGALFDFLVANPLFGRLAAWAQLERAESSRAEIDAYARKVASLASAGDGHPADTLALVLGLVTSWFMAAPALRVLAGDGQWSVQRLRDHRAELSAAVAAVIQR